MTYKFKSSTVFQMNHIKEIFKTIMFLSLAACLSANTYSEQSEVHSYTEKEIEQEAIKQLKEYQKPLEVSQPKLWDFTICFDEGSENINAEKGILKSHSIELNTNPKINVVITGYINKEEMEASRISYEKKAKAITSYFLINGVNRANIETRSFVEENNDIHKSGCFGRIDVEYKPIP